MSPSTPDAVLNGSLMTKGVGKKEKRVVRELMEKATLTKANQGTIEKKYASKENSALQEPSGGCKLGSKNANLVWGAEPTKKEMKI